ncbi:hypothetical protein BJ912DRAFT_980937 [Pholiota molesta]|nr:hypothetical protein BJ912DRAFT_980937 [Pholiota molesta]
MYARFARLFVIAAVALVGVSAAPAANVETLNARAAEVDGHLFVCTEINFTGTCGNIAFNVGECTNFNSPFLDSISSLAPDAGFSCTTYTDVGCTGETYTVTSPGSTSLPVVVDNKISSFLCLSQ